MLLQARFFAYNSPKTVWRRAGASALPRTHSRNRGGGYFKGEGRGGTVGRENKGTGMEGKRKGRERKGHRGDGKEGTGKENPMNVGWLRACVAKLENEKNVTSIM